MTEIWLIDLQRSAPALAELERATPRLTPRDRSRARAVKNPADRRQRIAITTALRILLERLAGPRSARQPFVTGPAGKPALADRSLQFSLSHIEGYALIGLTRAGEIGVDLERDRPLRLSERRRAELMAAATGLAGQPLARQAHQTLAGPAPDAAFLQAWCRLEAFAKARGLGIGRTLADLGLRNGQPRTPAEIEVACRHAARAAQLTVRDLPLGRGLYAAIAINSAARLRPQVVPRRPRRHRAPPGPPFAAPPPRRLTRTRRRGTREPFGA